MYIKYENKREMYPENTGSTKAGWRLICSASEFEGNMSMGDEHAEWRGEEEEGSEQTDRWQGPEGKWGQGEIPGTRWPKNFYELKCHI